MSQTAVPDPKVASAIAAIKAGDQDGARALLQEAIVQDPENGLAWLWLAVVVGTVFEQRRCLYRALSINPNNEMALEALRRLSNRDTSARLFRSAPVLPEQMPHGSGPVPLVTPAVSRPAVAEDLPQTRRSVLERALKLVRCLFDALLSRVLVSHRAADVAPVPAPVVSQPVVSDEHTLARQPVAKRVLKWVKRLFDVLLVLVILSAVGLILAPKLLRANLMVVLSQSMEPNIPMGSIVVTRPTPTAEIEVGDIITFRSRDFGDASDLVTHRVVELVGSGIAVRFRTQGDAVDNPDMKLVGPTDLAGRVWFSVPRAGFLVGLLRTPKGLLIFIGLPALLLVSGEIVGVLKTLGEQEHKQSDEVALDSGREKR